MENQESPVDQSVHKTNLKKKKERVSTAVIFGLAGILMMVIGGLPVYQNFQSLGWSTTPGKVTASSLVEGVRNGEDYQYKVYRGHIRYAYTMNNVKITGDVVFFGDEFYRYRARAEEVVNKYPVGTAVTVRYNPKRIDESVLENRYRVGSMFILALGLLCLLPLKRLLSAT